LQHSETLHICVMFQRLELPSSVSKHALMYTWRNGLFVPGVYDTVRNEGFEYWGRCKVDYPEVITRKIERRPL